MSQVAYLRNGIQPGPAPTYFDLQPQWTRSTYEPAASPPAMPRVSPDEWYRPKLVPAATHQHHTRQVLGLKACPFSRRIGKDPGHRFAGVNAHQGYGRHHDHGLSHKLDGHDRTAGVLLRQADSTYAGLNNRIPLPP